MKLGMHDLDNVSGQSYPFMGSTPFPSPLFAAYNSLTWRFLVPSMFLRVVEASSLVDWLAFCTLITEFMGLKILK